LAQATFGTGNHTCNIHYLLSVSMSPLSVASSVAVVFLLCLRSESRITLSLENEHEHHQFSGNRLQKDGGESDCIVTPYGGEVVGAMVSYQTNDTRYDPAGAIRCFRVYMPPGVRHRSAALPVIIYFHEMGSTATNACRRGGPLDLVAEADRRGFALVCADANVRWDVPEATNTTADPCDATASADHSYVRTVMTTLQKWPDWFDPSRIFLAGHSEGSTFSTWASFCFSREIRGFAPSGFGLKLHGSAVTKERCQGFNADCRVSVDDGIVIPGGWGACKNCQCSPLTPWRAKNVVGEDLRACIFSGCQDYFRGSISMMEGLFAEVGVPYDIHHFEGNHAVPQGFGSMLSNCFNISNDTAVTQLFRSTCDQA